MGRQTLRHKSSCSESETDAANFEVKFKLKTAPLNFIQIISFRLGHCLQSRERQAKDCLHRTETGGYFLLNTDEASEIGKVIKCHKASVTNE